MSADALTLIIESLVPVIQNIMSWIAKAKAASQQNKEWTPEEEAANQAAIDKLGIDPEVWQKVQPL